MDSFKNAVLNFLFGGDADMALAKLCLLVMLVSLLVVLTGTYVWSQTVGDPRMWQWSVDPK